jgi:1-acyl-sn-glycerol-3-phosphate acyltransferase
MIMFPIALITRILTGLFDKRLRILQQVSCFWGYFLVWSNPLWKVTFRGKNHMKPGQPYVIICNHQSFLDILVLYGLFRHFKWVSKSEIFQIPVVGWNMSLNKYVSVKRSKKFSHLAMLNACEEHLRRGSSIMIFPEGTRSKDGEIHSFKEGAFRVALAAKVSIIPIVIN